MELLDKRGQYRANGFISKPASIRTIEQALKNNNTSSLKSNVSTVSAPVTDKNVILVVDDDAFNLTMISKILRMAGHNVVESRNGLNATETFERYWQDIKVILMDCEMPVMNGWEATRRIVESHKKRAEIHDPKHKIVIYGLTGHVGEESRQRCVDAGMKDVLEKPITIDKLRTII